jgi:hypothetical protein
MGNVGVIDTFLNTFTTYIDSGFGLLKGEIAYLSSTLIVLDITLAGLFWACHVVIQAPDGTWFSHGISLGGWHESDIYSNITMVFPATVFGYLERWPCPH